MQKLHRAAMVLILPGIVYFGVSCDRSDAPTETAAPADGLSLSRGDRGDGNGKFFLSGTAQLDKDPENPANDVIRIRTDIPPHFGTVSRTVNVKIDKLDNMLEFKAWYQLPKTCIGGSPRFQLAIDRDGDGDSDGNVFLDTGMNGSGAGCLPHTWLYEDFTGGDGQTGLGLGLSTGFTTPNEENECAAAQLGGPGVPGAGVPWSVCEEYFNTAWPNHVVCTVSLVDDTFNAVGMSGTAYYDLISAGRATWTDRSDLAGRGSAPGCQRRGNNDDDDDEDDDDEDEDD